jgi:hypothetical protein
MVSQDFNMQFRVLVEQLNNQFSKYQLNSTLGIPFQIIEKEKGLISYQKNKNGRGKDIQKKEGKK